MKTKSFFLTSLLFAFLLFCSPVIRAQTAKANLDQLHLALQRIGTWEATYGKDTVEVWETKQYGESYINTVSLAIKGIKSHYYIANYSFDSKEGKFKGFNLYANGIYATWIALWTTEKKFSLDVVQNFRPETVLRKYEIVYETPTSMTFTRYNTAGIKIYEHKFKKVK
jgi:hypothetical protein